MVMSFFVRDVLYSPGQKIGEYRVKKVSGEGRYGICYLVSDERQQYILKQLKRFMRRQSAIKAGFEVEILSAISHEYVPRFIRKIEEEGVCGYLLEHKEGETFEDLIYFKNRVFPRSAIHDVGMQLISIIKYLHKSGVVHRDIRTPNALYSDGRVSLVDFGLARWVDERTYRPDIDFSYLGDFLLHLHYTSYTAKSKKKKPWHEELDLRKEEMLFLKRLLGIEKKYRSIDEVEQEYLAIIAN